MYNSLDCSLQRCFTQVCPAACFPSSDSDFLASAGRPVTDFA